MGTIREKVEAELKTGFPGNAEYPEIMVMLSESQGKHRVGGMLIWDGFTGLSQVDRQRRVWRTLRERLTDAEQEKLGTFITLTPREMNSIDSAA